MTCINDKNCELEDEKLLKIIWEREMKNNAEILELLNSLANHRTKQNEELKPISFEEWKKQKVVEEEEKDVCVGCDKVVVVSYGLDEGECVGYSIANCNTCDKMLCRECLDTDIESLCKYCRDDNFIKWTAEDFCDRDTCYFCKTKDIWESKHEDAVCIKCAEVWKYDEDDDGYRKCE